MYLYIRGVSRELKFETSNYLFSGDAEPERDKVKFLNNFYKNVLETLEPQKFFYHNGSTYIMLTLRQKLNGKIEIVRYFYKEPNYEEAGCGEVEIKKEGENYKCFLNRYTSKDINYDVFFYRNNTDEVLKSVKQCNKLGKNYIIENFSNNDNNDSNYNYLNELDNFDKGIYYNQEKCDLKIFVNNIGNIKIFKKGKTDQINKIFEEEVKRSDGFNFALANQLSFSRLFINLEEENIKKIRFFEEIDINLFKNFNNIKDLNEQLETFLLSFGLEIKKGKPNFAIIPVCMNVHISTLLIDLSFYKEDKNLKDRLYSFDSSLYHYNPNIFSGLIKDENKLSDTDLQLTGCCGYWTSCFIEECSKMNNIEEIKQKFKTGEMQLKVASKVSELIDHVANLSKLSLDSNYNYKDDNYLIINSEYYLLNKDVICNSTCVNLNTILKLCNNENFLISSNCKESLKNVVIKQNENLFDIKQERIEYLQKKYDYLITKMGHDLPKNDDEKKCFCEYLAQLEYIYKKIEVNHMQQKQYLIVKEIFDKNYGYNKGHQKHLWEYFDCQEMIKTYNKTYNKKYNDIDKHFVEYQQYYKERQNYYNSLYLVEKSNIVNNQNLIENIQIQDYFLKQNKYSTKFPPIKNIKQINQEERLSELKPVIKQQKLQKDRLQDRTTKLKKLKSIKNLKQKNELNPSLIVKVINPLKQIPQTLSHIEKIEQQNNSGNVKKSLGFYIK